jgi:hypothetical protein
MLVLCIINVEELIINVEELIKYYTIYVEERSLCSTIVEEQDKVPY